MNPEDTESETGIKISGYFDDALSGAECSDLAARLQKDPCAALAFARTARIHALLEAAAPARPAGRTAVLRRRWFLAGAAAAALIAIGVAVWLQLARTPDTGASLRPVVTDAVTFKPDRAALPPGVNLRIVKAAAAPVPVSMDLLLSHYYVHANPHGLNVREALRLLERAIAEANILNRSDLAALRFTAGRVTVPDSLNAELNDARSALARLSAELSSRVSRWKTMKKIDGEMAGDPLVKPDIRKLQQAEAASLATGIKVLEQEMDEHRRCLEQPDPKIRVPYPGPYTIKEYLDICSLFREVRQEPDGVLYSVPVSHPGGTLPGVNEGTGTSVGKRTRTFRLPPDQFKNWYDRSTDSQALTDLSRAPGNFAAPHKPSATEQVAPPGTQTSSLSPFPAVDRISVSREDSSITITASSEAVARWEQIWNVCIRRIKTQHFLSTKFILCPREFLPAGFDPATGLILREPEFQAFARSLTQKTETSLHSATSIVVLSGQASSLQILTPLPLSPPVPPLDSDWLGLHQEILTTSVGETIKISGMVDLGLPNSSGLQAFPEIFDPANKLGRFAAEGAKHHQTGFDLWIPNRCTAIFLLDVHTSDQRALLACITAQTIDPSGQPVGP